MQEVTELKLKVMKIETVTVERDAPVLRATSVLSAVVFHRAVRDRMLVSGEGVRAMGVGR